MNNDEKVYNYVINNINNVLLHGIEYYENKNNSFKEKLVNIYDYINNDDNVEIVIEKEKPSVLKDSPDQEKIKNMTSDFMNKMMNIRISMLNIDDDSEEQTRESEKQPIIEIVKPKVEDKHKVEETSTLRKMLERLKNEDFDDISFDDNYDSLDKVSDEELLLNDKNEELFEQSKFDMKMDFDEIKPNKTSKIEQIDSDKSKEDEEHHNSLIDLFGKND